MQGFLVVAPIVLLMLLGAILRRTKFLSESDVSCLAKLVYWMISPCILFRGALQLEMDWGSHANYAAAIYLSAVVIGVLVFLFGRYVLRNYGGKVLPISVLASFRCNSIMVGIPVVMLAMGEAGIAPIAIYFAVTEAGYNLLSILGGELTRGEGGEMRGMMRKAVRGIATNPMLWASLSGLILSAFGFHRLPGPVDMVFTMIANMATGASVLMIGASLNLDSIRSNAIALLPDCAVRLLVHPALLYLCFLVFPVSDEIMKSAVIMTAAPAPNIAFVFAKGMGLNAEYAAGLIGMTTIGFVLTMPVWLNFMKVV